MKFDEIGNVMQRENLIEALNNITWKVSRPRQVVTANLKLAVLPVEKKTPCLVTDKSTLTLTTRSWLNAAKTLEDINLQEDIIQKELPQNTFLWTVSNRLAKKGPKSVPAFLLRVPEGLFQALYEAEFKQTQVGYLTFRNQVYLKVLRGFVANRWFLEKIFGLSPYDFAKGEVEGKAAPKRTASNALDLAEEKQASSLNYLSIDKYLQTTDGENTDKIMPYGAYLQLDELKTKGIQALKIEALDYDLTKRGGINLLMLTTLELMAGYFLMMESVSQEDIDQGRILAQQTALESPYAKDNLKQAQLFLAELAHFAAQVPYANAQKTLDSLAYRLKSPENTPAAKFLLNLGNYTAQTFILNQSKNDRQHPQTVALDTNSYRLLAEALLAGEDYQLILNEEGIIQVKNKLVKHGLQTSSNSALMTELWQNKQVAKALVQNAGFTTLEDVEIHSKAEFEKYFPQFEGLAVVVKNARNLSDEKTMLFRLPPAKETLWNCVQAYLKAGQVPLIEAVIPGSTYRALFFQDELLSVVERLPKSVVGDGHKTLSQLITLKNLTLGASEKATLAVQGWGMDTIIPRGTEVLLRYDATVGTGCRSLEVLDELDSSYVKPLKALAQALKLHDGALDVVIPNIYQPFNPKEAKMLIFLSAHPTTPLEMHENVVFGPQNIAVKILERL
ncbi:glutamate-cysteine ligase [Ligilactobacillus sp. WC1T17]|uniref:Glutamate-cysteine ligase n=1 Tax=Ligilactobacillus ruminis TaxID=1623 RepID=A0ABY1AAS6_9LACO|nr:glutamate-cysteine ligase [Ligilactobacillus ruminis]